MLKKPHYIVVILVVVAVVVLFKLPGPTVGRLKLAISGLFLPLFGLAGSAHESALQARGELVPRRQLVEELENLQKQNDLLQMRVQQTVAIENENARLRQAIGWEAQTHWNARLA